LVVAEYHAGKAVEPEINGDLAPGRLLDGAETRFGQVAKSDAGAGNWSDNAGGRGRCRGERKEALVVKSREIQAEPPEIV